MDSGDTFFSAAIFFRYATSACIFSETDSIAIANFISGVNAAFSAAFSAAAAAAAFFSAIFLLAAGVEASGIFFAIFFAAAALLAIMSAYIFSASSFYAVGNAFGGSLSAAIVSAIFLIGAKSGALCSVFFRCEKRYSPIAAIPAIIIFLLFIFD